MERSELQSRETTKQIGKLGRTIVAVTLAFTAPVAVSQVEAATNPEPYQPQVQDNQVGEQPTPTPENQISQLGDFYWWPVALAGALVVAIGGALALKRSSR